MDYYSNGKPAISKVKSFFFKLFILFSLLIAGTAYFLMSEFGNSFQLLKDVKAHTNKQMSSAYNKQSIKINNAIRNGLGLEQVKDDTKIVEVVKKIKPATAVVVDAPSQGLVSPVAKPTSNIPITEKTEKIN